MVVLGSRGSCRVLAGACMSWVTVEVGGDGLGKILTRRRARRSKDVGRMHICLTFVLCDVFEHFCISLTFISSFMSVLSYLLDFPSELIPFLSFSLSCHFPLCFVLSFSFFPFIFFQFFLFPIPFIK